ncbi:ABC transporter permease [Halobacteria archaeon AArc-m2/3/4]|uniref:ABC transporter permease n=1 Tax=Natronoglomus mannanivorans TaxID=2979990 RepID=A0AAP2Z0L6_9EURY|nr:ABC transporter permease [Halobacteria archaeon AArc-xg1-1]MCU4973829.1 ABC transporter permease [Halobacteria archaeon AArc-m2/3/4]
MKEVLTFLARRSIQGIFVVWGVITTVFLFRVISPTNPAQLMAPDDASPELVRQIEEDLGLTEPIFVQYVNYVIGVVQGDLGFSYMTNTPVLRRILHALPGTLELAVAALLFAVIVSIPLGIFSAMYRGTKIDSTSNLVSLGGVSTPNFWLAIMMVLFISVQFGLLPTSGRPIGLGEATGLLVFQGDFGGLSSWVAHMILPTIALGTYFMALLFRLTRNGVLEEMGKEYILAARGKGLPEPLLMYRYVLRNSLTPVVTVTGLQLGGLIGGSVVVESVFAWPGLGTLFIRSLNVSDWPMMQGILILVGAGYVLTNIAVDFVNAKLNPQVDLA